MKEIERKWLLKQLPNFINNEQAVLIEQSYLCLTPEVRVRMKYKLFARPEYVMTIKRGNDGLVRNEDEIDLSENQYLKLRKSIGCAPIKKDYYRYSINNTNLVIEVSIVDKGTPNQFYYAEVEFKSIEEANAFDLPEWFIDETSPEEVTYDPKYKMKNYWKETRIPTSSNN